MDSIHIICSCTQYDLNKVAGDETNSITDVLGVEVHKLVQKKVLILFYVVYRNTTQKWYK